MYQRFELPQINGVRNISHSLPAKATYNSLSMEELKLNTEAKMPAIGFGTWQLQQGREAEQSVAAALDAGYRLIDTAKIYGNETSVGQAIKKNGLDRKDIFLTTKLWPSDFLIAEQAFGDSLERLGVEYVDLYLIHWPNGSTRSTAWEAFEKIHEEGQAKAVGVSNYMVEHLEELFEESELIPAVNQIEFHPFVYKEQQPVLELCRQKGIVVEAYSPLAQGQGLENRMITSIADTYGKSSAQVMLRWAIQHGTVPIPRSSNAGRIRLNLDVFDFELTDQDMAALDDLS
jgi:diketogulonate reductase-like aldo/keto reductase